MKVLAFVFLAFVVMGCVSAPTPTPSPSATEMPTAVPTLASPSPTIVIEVPTPSPEAMNYSKEQLVTEYLKAVDAENYEKAYALISRDFKNEDPEAQTVEKFAVRVKLEYPYGLTFSDVKSAVENTRVVYVNIVKGGSSISQKIGFIVVFESGYWKLRIPLPTQGLYYNSNSTFQLRSSEIANLLEIALNDHFSKFDVAIKGDPIKLELFDKANFVYYGQKTVSYKRSDGLIRKAKLEFNFGPSFILGGLSQSVELLSDRPLYFEHINGIKTAGGSAGFYCYAKSSKLIFKMKADQNFADVYSYESNIFAPTINGLNKICPP